MSPEDKQALNREVADLPSRWQRRITVDSNGCWIWNGTRDTKDYGAIYSGCKRRVPAHRVIYVFLMGPIPEGKLLDHLCRVHPCVNPAHLEPVSNKENVLRGISFAAVNAQKSHCSNGHEFTDGNTYRRTDGTRDCRICRSTKKKEQNERTKARHAERKRLGLVVWSPRPRCTFCASFLPKSDSNTTCPRCGTIQPWLRSKAEVKS